MGRAQAPGSGPLRCGHLRLLWPHPWGSHQGLGKALGSDVSSVQQFLRRSPGVGGMARPSHTQGSKQPWTQTQWNSHEGPGSAGSQPHILSAYRTLHLPARFPNSKVAGIGKSDVCVTSGEGWGKVSLITFWVLDVLGWDIVSFPCNS